MSSNDLLQKEDDAVLDDTAADFSPAEQEEFDQLSTNDPDADDQVGEGYTGSTKKPKSARISRNKKLIGGGAVGLILGGGIMGVILLSPVVKLENFLANINQRAFGYVTSAVEARAENLLEHYMARHVLSLQACGKTINKDCRRQTDGVASGLFATWQDAKIEEKLFDRFGLDIETSENPTDGKYRVTLRDRNGRLITLNDGELKRGRFTGGDCEFGRQMRLFMKEETKWYEVMQRKSVRKYLARKHDTKNWCFLKCNERDNVDKKIVDAKTKVKYKFVERFVYPFSGKYGFIINCISKSGSGSTCSPEEIRNQGVGRDKLPDESVDEIVKFIENKKPGDSIDIDGKPIGSLSEYLIKRLVTKVLNKEAAQTVLSAIPIAGQVYLVVTVASAADKIDTFVADNGLSKFAADINASQYIEYYQVMRSSGDELKSNKLSIEEVGALLGEFDGAEKSRVYQANNDASSQVASLFGGTAYAQSTDQDPSYTCKDGKPIPEGEQVCMEKRVTRSYAVEDIRDNAVVDAAASFMTTYDACYPAPLPNGSCAGIRPKTVLDPVLKAIESASGLVSDPLVNAAMSAANAFPPTAAFLDLVQDKMSQFSQWLMGRVFPLPVQQDSPGRDKYDGLEAGGELVANGFAKGTYDDGESSGLGAVPLTSEQTRAIREERIAQDNYELENSSLFNRVASLDNPHSVATNIAMNAPTSLSSVFTNLSSVFLKGFTNFGAVFSSFNTSRASAAVTDQNPFGITRYGYPTDSAAFTSDPDIYTEEYCAQTKLAREASKREDPQTGFEEYDIADPCMLEKAAAEAAGAYFTND